MYIEKVDTLTDEIVDAVHRLIPEIGTHKPLPTHAELAVLVRSVASTLIIARYPDAQGPIAGMLTITIYQVPTGIRSIVEDVAVDSSFRRMGLARALMETALIIAKGAGANGVALTSNPKREAANRLYQSMGFERRETNAYIYRFHDR